VKAPSDQAGETLAIQDWRNDSFLNLITARAGERQEKIAGRKFSGG
jgi:hypothetical protein